MKKSIYSMLVIISTIITCALIYWIFNNGVSGNGTYDNLVEVKKDEIKNEVMQNNSNKDKQTDEVNKKGNDKMNDKSKEVEPKVENKDKVPFRESKNNIVGIIDEENDISQEEKDKYKSVFKVDSRTIVSDLSMMDKVKLLKISSKLSLEDYKKLDGYLKSSNAESGVKEAYKFLKDKLSSSDIDKIKEILNKYIDVEVVEKTQ